MRHTCLFTNFGRMTIEELEGYFTGIELPDQIELETGVVIVDVPLFLQSHFEYIKDNPTLKSIDVFVLRLHKAMGVIEAKNLEEDNVAISAPIVAEAKATGNLDHTEMTESNDGVEQAESATVAEAADAKDKA